MRKTLTISALAATGFAAALSGQQQGSRPARAGLEPHGGEKAAERPAFLALETGREAKFSNHAGEIVGYVHTHVVARKSGRVLYVVVQGEDDASRRLVPYQRFRWNPERRIFELEVTPDELSSLPQFRPDEVQTLVDPTGEPAGGTRGASARPGEGKTREAGDQEREEEAKPRNVLSNEIEESPVKAGGAAVGTITELLLEPGRGTIPLVLVKPASAVEGRAIVVPWAAMDRNADGTFELKRGAADLTGAPAIDSGELDTLSDPDTLKSIYRFYGVRPRATPPAASGVR